MNDLISRQAAIDAGEEKELLKEGNKALKEAIERLKGLRLPSAQQEQQWIPCGERLPDDGQWVLVWGHEQRLPIMMFRESGAWINDQFEFYTTITHWMPLPEPPKEVKV